MRTFLGVVPHLRHRFRLITLGLSLLVVFGCWWIAQDDYLLPAFSPLASVGAPAAVMLAMLGPVVCFWPWLRHGTTTEILRPQRVRRADCIWSLVLTAVPFLLLLTLNSFAENDLLLTSARNYLGAIGIYLLWLSIGWRIITPLVLVFYVIGVSFFGPSRREWFVFWPLHDVSEPAASVIAVFLMLLGIAAFALGGHVRRIGTRGPTAP